MPLLGLYLRAGTVGRFAGPRIASSAARYRAAPVRGRRHANDRGGAGSAPGAAAQTRSEAVDFIEVAALLDQSTFAGTTAQLAISQGYLYFVQSGTSTKVMFDVNGGTHGDAANNFAIVELDNIAPADLRADHLLV